MQITILAVGKLKETYWTKAMEEYKKRLTAYCKLTVVEVKESQDDNKEEEGETLLQKIKKEDYVITLEIKGEEFSSEGFAGTLENLAISGKSKVTFVIGGSNGLSKKVSDRANLKMSFSKLTFPHQMMRVILVEQIYRGYRIIRKEAYHK